MKARLNVIVVLGMVLLALAQSSAEAALAFGGNQVTDLDGYRTHVFTSDGTLQVTIAGDLEVLLVGGGGGGGGTGNGGAGGGGGGVIHIPVAAVGTGSYAVIVGTGGAGGGGPNVRGAPEQFPPFLARSPQVAVVVASVTLTRNYSAVVSPVVREEARDGITLGRLQHRFSAVALQDRRLGTIQGRSLETKAAIERFCMTGPIGAAAAAAALAPRPLIWGALMTVALAVSGSPTRSSA